MLFVPFLICRTVWPSTVMRQCPHLPCFVCWRERIEWLGLPVLIPLSALAGSRSNYFFNFTQILSKATQIHITLLLMTLFEIGSILSSLQVLKLRCSELFFILIKKTKIRSSVVQITLSVREKAKRGISDRVPFVFRELFSSNSVVWYHCLSPFILVCFSQATFS